MTGVQTCALPIFSATYQGQPDADMTGPWFVDEEYRTPELVQAQKTKSSDDVARYTASVLRRVDARKLTFVAPVAKILLMREIRMNLDL